MAGVPKETFKKIVNNKDLEIKPVKIGAGGFGDIFKTQVWGVEVVLKLFRGSNRETEAELRKEAMMMLWAEFNHTLPLRAIYVDNYKGNFQCGLVMPYMPNGSLDTLFKKVSSLPLALKFRIIHQVALGMSYLHHFLKPPLLHLDLKPANVLLSEYLDVQLSDFGLSKSKSTTIKSTDLKTIAGTCAYMPPEAFESNSTSKEPFDIYSFAILIWAVLAEKEPYEGKSHQQIICDVGMNRRPNIEQLNLHRLSRNVPEAMDLMQKCWHKNPENRPPFRECRKHTEQMFEHYKPVLIKGAVRIVQDRLRHSADKVTSAADQV